MHVPGDDDVDGPGAGADAGDEGRAIGGDWPAGGGDWSAGGGDWSAGGGIDGTLSDHGNIDGITPSLRKRAFLGFVEYIAERVSLKSSGLKCE